MPPRTRSIKGSKPLKENVVTVSKIKTKSIGKITKPARKALADKTNSASDDNIDNTSNKPKKKNKNEVIAGLENIPRPRRERRVPTRFIGNNILNNLSNTKDKSDKENVVLVISPAKRITTIGSPLKTPELTKSLENSLIANRPKRICRLPSKFDDHSISPSKYIPVQPCHASTPIIEKNKKDSNVVEKVAKSKKNQVELTFSKVVSDKRIPQKRHIQNSPESRSDSNNNAKRRLIRNKQAEQLKTKSPNDKVKTPQTLPKKIANKSFSYRVLEDKKKSSFKDDNNLDIYEFTFDPNEEPPPAKKKRKRTVKKKPAKPKTVVFKNIYDQNVSKALAALKNVVAKKPDVPKSTTSAIASVNTIVTDSTTNSENSVGKQNIESKVQQDIQSKLQQNVQSNVQQYVQSVEQQSVESKVQQNIQSKVQQNGQSVVQQNVQSVVQQNVESTVQQNSNQASEKESAMKVASQSVNITNPTQEVNYNSVRVEDIAADFEMSAEDYNDINYSPVNSPQHPKSPHEQTLERSVHNKDPLNLQEDVSFFNENPVASSSMNMSTRHPQASPWRIEFGNLPIRWQVNTYVKPNMTPAVESSFISSEESNKKKHVYTNMIGPDDSATEVEQNQSNLKQTSIISFIREVVQRSAQKKKRRNSMTPTKANNLFNDLSNVNIANEKKSKKPEKVVDKNSKVDENVSSISENSKQDKENLHEIAEKKKKKTKVVEKEKDGTFFGFDESEDLENVSPVKVNPKVRALRPRSRAVLQEINAMSGPMRALPLAAKSKAVAGSDAVNKMYEEIKSAADAPVFPENDAPENLLPASEVTTVDEASLDVDEHEQSVHLFEDIELVHHLKPTRKSYGKAKKVTFRQHSTSSEGTNLERDEPASSEEDDLADLTFTMPTIQPQKKVKKKKTKKQKMSKKEQQAMDEWAAGFNSMCEDIEDVPLIVE